MNYGRFTGDLRAICGQFNDHSNGRSNGHSKRPIKRPIKRPFKAADQTADQTAVQRAKGKGQRARGKGQRRTIALGSLAVSKASWMVALDVPPPGPPRGRGWSKADAARQMRAREYHMLHMILPEAGQGRRRRPLGGVQGSRRRAKWARMSVTRCG